MMLRTFSLALLTAMAINIEANAAAAPRRTKKKTPRTAIKAVGKAETDSIFFYSPGERKGMRLAVKSGGGQWTDGGQVFSSDYGPWGQEKRMFTPFVKQLSDGTYAAVFSVNQTAPCFAVAFSDNLITWRPQDYPLMTTRGCLAPVVREDGGGRYTVIYKTPEGKYRQTVTTDRFRHFSPDAPATAAEYAAAAGQPDAIAVGKETFKGNAYRVDSATIARVRAWFAYIDKSNRENGEKLSDDATRFAALPQTVDATITVDGRRQKAISDKLVGIFFEDISYAADGGLYAEMVQNRDFEYSAADHKGWTPATAWTADGGELKIVTDGPLSANNPHYAVMGAGSITNEGWDGMAVKAGETYDFSFFIKHLSKKSKKFIVRLVAEGKTLAEAVIKTKGEAGAWKQYAATLCPAADAPKTVLTVSSDDKAEAGLDMISLFPRDTFRGRKNGLRKDLAQTLADLKPKFVRFPGGCMSHGDGIDNIYHWDHTVGPLQDRKPDRNVWNYHQTRGLGFFEYFQFCEDIGAEPLPVLAAGVPCQNSKADARGYAGQQGGIDMADMPAYIDELCNLIDWANGDPATNKWAKMRAEAGHPAPFNLKYIGIGNEDLISTTFEERCKMICEAIRKRHPEIIICGTVGPFHYPTSDYIEGWKFANENKASIDMVDEHYYESIGWFLHNQHYYDNYDRNAPKVYLGEWAAKVGRGGLDCALVEAAHLNSIERNGDVVVMTSYAPLLSKNGHSNWSPDMIYYGNTSIELTPSYETQRLFSVYSGDKYLDTEVSIADSATASRVAASVVKDTKTGKTYLKVTNILPRRLDITLSLKDVPLSSQQLRYEGFSGKPGDRKVSIEKGTLDVHQDTALKVSMPPYSFRVFEL